MFDGTDMYQRYIALCDKRAEKKKADKAAALKKRKEEEDARKKAEAERIKAKKAKE